MLVLWEEKWAPDDPVTGEKGPTRFEGIRNDLTLVTVVRIPSSGGFWRVGLHGLAPHPALNDHDIMSPERGRYKTSDEAMAAADNYLGLWLIEMDMTWMDPIDFGD